MNNSAVIKKQSEQTKKAEKYMYKYIHELKIHFNLSDNQILHILNIITRKFKKNCKSFSLLNLFSKRNR